MKRIALLLTALVGLIVASCGDEKQEPPVLLYGKYAAETVTITENGNTFTAPGDVTLQKFDSNQSDKAKLTISSFPPYDHDVVLIVSVKEEQDKISFTGDFRCSEEYEGYPGFKGTASGSCTSGKLNIVLDYNYYKINETTNLVRPFKTIELDLSENYFEIFGNNQETVYYNGKEYSRKDLLKEVLPSISEILRENNGGTRLGFWYQNDGTIIPYYRLVANGGLGDINGKFRMIFSNFAADEEGALYVCKKLFGKDEIIPELYSQKLGNYYIANFEWPIRNFSLYRLVCPDLNLKFWRDFLIENGKESDAAILTFLIDNSYNPKETFGAWAMGLGA